MFAKPVKFMVISFLVVFSIAVVVSPGAHAQVGESGQSLETVTASIPKYWPPHYIANTEEPPTGFAVEVLDAVAALAGYRVEYTVWTSMKEAYDSVVDGNSDLMPNVGVIPERMKDFSFTDPVETFVVSVFVREDTLDIRSPDDLDGRRVAVLKRNVGLKLMKKRPAVESVIYDDVRTAIFDLLSGRVDALVYPAPVILKLINEVRIKGRIKIIEPPLREIKRAIGIHPSRNQIHQRLGAAVTKFVGTPEYQKIYIKWFGEPERYWTAVRVGTVMGGLLIFIVVMFVAWHYRTMLRLNKVLEERVQERTEDLQKAQAQILRNERLATLGQLTGTVAHELRNPLGAVMSSVAVIGRKAAAANLDLGQTLDRAIRGIDRCDGIITDLLDYARSQGVKLESIDIDRCLGQLLSDYDFPDTISVQQEFGLDGLVGSIDMEQIRRVLINILDNACQAITDLADSDTGKNKVKVVTRKANDGFEICISDSGPGMTAEVLEQIFEPLYSTRSFGVGLGLPHVEKIVGLHDGKLTVNSEVGTGTEVTVWLPTNHDEAD